MRAYLNVPLPCMTSDHITFPHTAICYTSLSYMACSSPASEAPFCLGHLWVQHSTSSLHLRMAAPLEGQLGHSHNAKKASSDNRRPRSAAAMALNWDCEKWNSQTSRLGSGVLVTWIENDFKKKNCSQSIGGLGNCSHGGPSHVRC